MSQHNDIETPNTFESDASLRMALRGLPREIEPANDLWPGIAARIQAAPARAAHVASAAPLHAASPPSPV